MARTWQRSRRTTAFLVIETLEDRTVPSFLAPQIFKTDNGINAITTADLRQVGQLDLVTANRSANTVNVLLGIGDGTFAPAAAYAAGTGPFAVRVADVNGDGIPDLVVADFGTFPDYTDSGVSVLLGNGDGTFRPAVHYAAGVSPRDVAVADLNGDGTPDLAVADAGANGTNAGSGVEILLGNGDGSFQAPVHYDAGLGTSSIAVGDFKDNGIPDLVVANAGQDYLGTNSHLSVLFGNGDGSFQAPVDYSTGGNTNFVTVADLNGDGILDWVATNRAADVSAADVSVLLGRGDGSFEPAMHYAVTPGATALAVGDFNGDGVPDVVSVSNFSNDGAADVLLGNGDGTFHSAGAFAVGPFPSSVAVGDFNGDGTLDFVTADREVAAGCVSVVLGNGDGSFRVGVSTNIGGTGIPEGAAVGDFNGDGVADMAVVDTNSAVVLLGNGDATFQAPVAYPAGAVPTSIAVADVNGDGIPDLIVGDSGTYPYTNGGVAVLLGNGDGTFQPPIVTLLNNSTQLVAVTDVTGNGKLDLVVNFGQSSTAAVLLGNGDGTFQAPIPAPPGSGLSSLQVVDVNGDGKPDLITFNTFDGSVNVFLGNGDGTFQNGLRTDVGQYPTAVAVTDLNGDGIPDLVVAEGIQTYQLSRFLGNGDGTFRLAGSSPIGIGINGFVVGDVNGDGIPDLMTRSSFDTTTVMFGTADGDFQVGPTYYVNFSVTSMALADVNGDGFPDLVTSNIGVHGVTVLLNGGDWGTSPHGARRSQEARPLGVWNPAGPESTVPVRERTVDTTSAPLDHSQTVAADFGTMAPAAVPAAHGPSPLARASRALRFPIEDAVLHDEADLA
jgi:hypothetical protein